MTKILITGTDSFVGKNFIQYSSYKNIDTISLFKNKPEDIDFEKYEVVIHLVAIVHQTISIPEEDYFRINKDLCLRVAENAKKAGIKQFIFLSTVKVYGKFIRGSKPWTEDSECYPDDSYGKSKYEAEKSLKELEDKDFIVSVLRTPLVYGEGVRANMLSIMKLISVSHILPFKDLHNRRNFTSAENLVAFIDRIIKIRASGTFIAMDDDAISTSQLVKLIARYLGRKIILFKLPDFIIKTGIFLFPNIFDRLYGSFEMDNSKTLKILDFKPPITINEGIKKMVESFKNNLIRSNNSQKLLNYLSSIYW
jgi:nucleoside-diphosphate-sugar epimerase